MQYKGKTVIITGGASGMGLLCGKNFYQEGANVVLVDVNKQALEEINKEMPNALCLTADITEFEQVKYTVDTAMEKFKSVDFMINMAGGSSCRMRQSFGEFCDRDIKDIKWGMDINLMAPIYYCHEVMRIMRAQKSGVIINIGSIKGVEGDPAGSDYTISKSAVMTGLTESMAILGAPYGVRCCCVSPGPVMTRPGMGGMKTLIGRQGQPQEVVDLIMYLCSDKAGFINGCNYMIDGGRSCVRGY